MGWLSDAGKALGAVFPVAAIANIGAGILGGGLGYASAQQQNDATDERARASMNFEGAQAEKSMAFSAQQAQNQMDFQERMSNTSHQREMKDLRSAGLNPLLSLNAGASTPAGASGQGAAGQGSAGPVVPELGAFSSSARDWISTITQWNNSSANVSYLKANTAKTQTENRLAIENEPERRARGKVWTFIDRMLDRMNRTSPGRGRAEEWIDPERNKFDDWIEGAPR